MAQHVWRARGGGHDTDRRLSVWWVRRVGPHNTTRHLTSHPGDEPHPVPTSGEAKAGYRRLICFDEISTFQIERTVRLPPACVRTREDGFFPSTGCARGLDRRLANDHKVAVVCAGISTFPFRPVIGNNPRIFSEAGRAIGSLSKRHASRPMSQLLTAIGS